MLKKFKKHLNVIFLFYPKTKQLKEFKEELLGVLMEKHEENLAKGMSENESFKICVASIDGYKETMTDLASQQSEDLTTTQTQGLILGAFAFWTGIVLLYFILSFTLGWEYTWLTFIAGVIGFLIMVFFVLLKLGKKNSQYILVRCSNFILSILSTTALYLIISFATKAWEYTWVIFIVGITFAYGIDIIFRVKNKAKAFKFFDFSAITMLIALIIYFTLSFTVKGAVVAWTWSWLVFVGWIFLQFVTALIWKYIIFKKSQQ